MAEGVAAVGLVGSILQLIDFGAKIVSRMNELSSGMKEVPKAFHNIESELPLIVGTLKRIKEHAAVNEIEEPSSLESIIDGCLGQIVILEKILDKVSPYQNQSSRWRTGLKALKSLKYDKEVEQISVNLHRYIVSLNLFQSTNSVVFGRALVERGKPAPTQTSPGLQCRIVVIPFHRNDAFVGRQSILDEIQTQLDTGHRRAALVGIGGVGKSQIAIEFCYRYKEEHTDAHVFWVHCSSVDRFEQTYNELALKLGIPGINSPNADRRKLLVKWLSDATHGKWLIVLDNADDEDVFFSPSKNQSSNNEHRKRLIDFIPRSSCGSVLVTSRDRRMGRKLVDREKVIEVSPFEEEDAKLLLRAKLPDRTDINDADATELVEELHKLPLAVTQAAAYISEEDVTISHYVKLLRNGDRDTSELLETSYHDAGRDFNSQNAIFATWKITFDQIWERNPRAAEILSLMAVLDRQAIPNILLRSTADSQVTHDRAIGMLKAFSLITEEKQEATYAMHRLVQLSTQRWLEIQNSLMKWQIKALDILDSIFLLSRKYESWKAENWKMWNQISPHAYIVSHYDFKVEANALQRARILIRMAYYVDVKGEFGRARSLAEESLAIYERFLGHDHEVTLENQAFLIHILVDQGKFEENERLNRELLAIREKALGLNHSATLSTKADMCIAMCKQGKLNEAEELLRPLLVTTVATLGEEDPFTLENKAVLAAILQKKEEYEESQMLCKAVIRSTLETQGIEYVEAQNAMLWTANTLKGMRKFDEAEQLRRELLDSNYRVLGEEHPDTHLFMSDLADNLCSQQKYEEAHQVYHKVVNLSKKVSGESHHETLYYEHQYARLLKIQHRYGEAAHYFREASDGREKLLGKEHWETLESMRELSEVLELQKQDTDVEAQESNKEHEVTNTESLSAALEGTDI